MKAVFISNVIPGLVALLAILALVFLQFGTHERETLTVRQPEPSVATVQDAAKVSQTTTTAPTPTPVTRAAATGTASTPATMISGSWPGFRGANHDNIVTDTTPLAQSWGSQGPPVLWSVDLGEGYAGAAVLNGRVYVLDYDQTAKADTLRCFSFADGKELWRYAYPVDIKRNHGMSRTTPAVSDKYVVTLGPKCHLLCADAVTGKVYWQRNLVDDFGVTVPQWYAGQCPIIDGDKVIIGTGGKALLVAFDCATGKVRWQTPNPRGWKMTHSSVVPVSFGGKRMYVYCASDGVVGVSDTDGSLLWDTTEWKVSTATVPTPVPIGDGRIFITGGYNAGSIMLRLRQNGGKVGVETLFRLTSSICGSDQQTPILYKDHIYAVISGGQLVCLDLNGKQLWKSGQANRFGLGPYIIAGGMLYLLNDTGLLTLAKVTPSGYQQLAQAQILQGHDAWGPIAIAGGRLIARDLTRMVCVDIAKH